MICPYFVSRTNGHKNYINCSEDGMSNALRLEFDEVDERKDYYNEICLDEFDKCPMFQKFRR